MLGQSGATRRTTPLLEYACAARLSRRGSFAPPSSTRTCQPPASTRQSLLLQQSHYRGDRVMTTPLPLNPWLGMGLELLALTLLMLAIHLYQRTRGLAPETSRKLFHLSGGLTTLALPW